MKLKNLKLLRDWHASHVVPFDMLFTRSEASFPLLDFPLTLFYWRMPDQPRDSSLGADCGTCGCGLGWAPLVDGLPKPTNSETWRAYSKRLFDLSDKEWDFLFSGDWAECQETNTQAAFIKRCDWLLAGKEWKDKKDNNSKRNSTIDRG